MALTKPLRRRRAELLQARIDRLTTTNARLLLKLGEHERSVAEQLATILRLEGNVQQLRCQLANAEWRAEVLARMEEAAHAESVLRGDRLRQAGLSVPVLPEVPCG